ncbi:urease accessory protein [Chitinophaga sp. CF118]|uniref:urease accessory protein UreF n=1 Tax=Chitinophaga sp. CF118 TaxID=1884367 RepID=UPI0008E95DFE|nr:urease accessory protein UreF [Chitinophaga sp. CF118]SFE77853.1 urease accessory protein [Chitinophaga sp. CF118]
MQTWLPHLLHLSDPTLPVGAYTHSNGLETYVQQGLVSNGKQATAYIRNMLEHNLPYNDALFVVLAYRVAEANDVEQLILLDQECTALKAPQELRVASQKLGIRLIKLLTPLTDHAFGNAYSTAIRKGMATGHYSLVYGVYAFLLGVPLQEALTAYYYNAATGMVTNCVKLVPLGQQEGQQILFALLPLLPQLAAQTLTIPRRLAGRCSFAFDIRSMQHERLYSRLYMS